MMVIGDQRMTELYTG